MAHSSNNMRPSDVATTLGLTPFNKYDKEKKQDHLKPKANILLEPDVKLNDNIDNDSQPLNKTLDLYEFQENDLEEKASKSPEYDKLEEKTYTPLKAVNFDCYPILTKIDTNLNTDHRDYEDNEDFSESRDTSSYVPETEIESEGGEEETIIPIFKTINVTCPESTLTKDEPSESPIFLTSKLIIPLLPFHIEKTEFGIERISVQFVS
ncbi:uncharacterized protein LOC126892705 [Diabrotica virgifera virgifera]|uniref:Uncharacterized protein n=1 Tax=Diabrotica virgifera virgifera TaxID=50390 RepID=A0ABM5L779_DIAVI|nr:uncharacterized protein LOC126892705 [Diabrotica virgifera virgifera]